jgi:hypothetical protein
MMNKKWWAFRVDISTGKMEMQVPKKKAFTPKEIYFAHSAALLFIAATGDLLKGTFEKKEKDVKNNSKIG